MKQLDLKHATDIHGGTLGPGGGSDPGNSDGRSVNNPFPEKSEEQLEAGRSCFKKIVSGRAWACVSDF